MIRGRVQREVRKIINTKGLPYNEKIADKMRRQKYEQILTETNVDLQESKAYQAEEQKFYMEDNNSQNLLESEKNNFSTWESGLQDKYIRNYNNGAESFSLPISQLSNIKKLPVVPEQDLVIDVYISEEHKQKLIIRKGDSLNDVASSFILQHGLPESKKEQLIQLLEVSLSQALTPIDELAEEEELASARTQYKRKIVHSNNNSHNAF